MKKETLKTFIEFGIDFSESGMIRFIKKNVIDFEIYYNTIELN